MVGKRNFPAFLAISFFLTACFSSIIGLRHIDDTIVFVFFAAMGAFITDTAAFFFGINLGRHKLTKISPKKTWEGAIGGTFTSVLVISVYMLIVGRFAPWVPWVALATSIAAIFGDLAASLVKRKFDAKDYGAMIPGHGGMMDRCDSLMFAAPVAYLLISIFV
jgi:phosphatidate cytidylyltransferase